MFSQKLSDKKDGPEEFSSPFRKQESVRTTHKPRFQLQRRKWLKTLQIFPSISSWETPFPYLKLEILLLCQVSTAVFQSCVCVCVCACVCSAMSNSLPPHGLQPTRLLRPWDSPGKNTGVGCHFLLQGIFPTQGSNLVSQIATIVFAVTLWVSYLGCSQLVVSFSGLI